MHHRRALQSLTALALTILSACSATSVTGADPPTPADLIRCTQPRPQICTREYVPVCATLKDHSEATYATGCTACSDPDVVGYRPDPCE
jgi:hypothetical protein